VKRLNFGHTLEPETANKGGSVMIRIAIVEDDPRCSAQLEQFIIDYGHETDRSFLVHHFNNGEDLVEHYQPEFDIILMDVEMPFMDGLTAAGYIREKDTEVVIVFVTRLAQYAIQGYSVSALDYVLKPLSYFSFSRHLDRALQHVKRKENTCIVVASKGGSIKLDLDNIFYFERLGRQLMIHTRAGIHVSTATLQQMEEALEGKGFARCNKGYLVNLEHVDGIQDGCAVIQGDKLLISRGRRAPFLEALSAWMRGVVP